MAREANVERDWLCRGVVLTRRVATSSIRIYQRYNRFRRERTVSFGDIHGSDRFPRVYYPFVDPRSSD